MLKESVFVTLENDKDYLEAYFKICSYYQNKRLILTKLKNPRLREGDLENIRLESKDLAKQILKINSKVTSLEKVFWHEVDKSKQKGVRFAIEEIAVKYNLEAFEKKILLFILFLEYFETDKNICTVDELLSIFDTEDSFLFRMCNSKYLEREGNLFLNFILAREPKKRGEYVKTECLLTSRAIVMVAQALEGEKSKQKKPVKLGYSEEVGYIKEPEYKFEDVELATEAKEKIALFLDSLKSDNLTKLGVTQRIKKGLALAFLFFGPPGTGKSMLAEAIASYIGKKILVVEYPKIMNRWLGATDKNISRIFRSAEEEDLVILLDEADTLFYNRSFAFEEHDIRFVNEMLQELEKFKGVVVLTTNMDVLLDPALERRLSLKVKFELPSKELRGKIWRLHIPDKVKIAEGVNFEFLAEKYDFSGGNIKNAVLNAFRRLTSRNSDTLTMEDLVFGADLEESGMFNSKKQRVVVGFSA